VASTHTKHTSDPLRSAGVYAKSLNEMKQICLDYTCTYRNILKALVLVRDTPPREHPMQMKTDDAALIVRSSMGQHGRRSFIYSAVDADPSTSETPLIIIKTKVS
jgi:hypothetical protein